MAENLRPFDVITFGETMLRLAPPGYGRLEEATTLDVRVGGSESSTAVSLARLGLRAAWWSRLPDNALGRRIENEIRRWGVDVSGVRWDKKDGARAGLYFLDFGVAPRSTEVTYDRAESSINRTQLHDFDLETLQSARLLHLTGITPALSPACAESVTFLMQQAKAANVAISFDVNYRSRLWAADEAKRTLTRLFAYGVDVLLCPLADAETIFGIAGDGPTVAREMKQRFGAKSVVITCGGDGAAACDDRGDWAVSAFALGPIVDRVGAGDAFNAGVIMGWLQNDLPLGLQYGAAMAALKHTIPGDLLLATRAEIEAARAGEAVGIRR